MGKCDCYLWDCKAQKNLRICYECSENFQLCVVNKQKI